MIYMLAISWPQRLEGLSHKGWEGPQGGPEGGWGQRAPGQLSKTIGSSGRCGQKHRFLKQVWGKYRLLKQMSTE